MVFYLISNTNTSVIWSSASSNIEWRNLDNLILIRPRGRFKIKISPSFSSKKEKIIEQYLGVLNLLIQLLTYLIYLTNLL